MQRKGSDVPDEDVHGYVLRRLGVIRMCIQAMEAGATRRERLALAELIGQAAEDGDQALAGDASRRRRRGAR
jgi:hypothetical protein